MYALFALSFFRGTRRRAVTVSREIFRATFRCFSSVRRRAFHRCPPSPSQRHQNTYSYTQTPSSAAQRHHSTIHTTHVHIVGSVFVYYILVCILYIYISSAFRRSFSLLRLVVVLFVFFFSSSSSCRRVGVNIILAKRNHHRERALLVRGRKHGARRRVIIISQAANKHKRAPPATAPQTP